MSSKKTETLQIEISPKTILLILGIIIGGVVLYTLRNVAVMVFIAIVISSALGTPVSRLEKRNFPRWLAVTTVYLGALLGTVLILSLISVPLARQSINLAEGLPNMFAKLSSFLNDIAFGFGAEQEIIQTNYVKDTLEQMYGYISQNIGSVVSAGAHGITGIFQILIDIFGGVFTFISILTISIYITYDHDGLIEILTGYINDRSYRERVSQLFKDIEDKLGSWLRGQLTVATISGALTWIALSLLQVPYALPLGLLTAIMVNIPVFGATLSLVPALIVALATGNLVQVIAVPAVYIVIQQIENNVVAPKVMGNAIGIRPLVVILAILIGAELSGLIGVLVAVPIAGMIQLALEFYYDIAEAGSTN